MMSTKEFTQNICGAIMTALFIALPMCAKASPMVHETMADSNTGEQLWWGYFTDSDVATLAFDGYLGYNRGTTLEAAICIPAGHGIAGEGTIKAVRFWLGDDISAISSDLTLWIAPKLPASVSAATYKQTVTRESLKSRLNEVELTVPYEVNNEQCYIGYSFMISKKSYLVMGGGADAENAWFYRYDGRNWLDFNGEGFGKLAFQVLLDGLELKSCNATPSDFGISYVQQGGQQAVPVMVQNFGKETITSIGYTVTTQGNVSAEKTCSVNSLKFNDAAPVLFTFDADSECRKHEKTLTITKVNGKANEATQTTATGMLITVTEKPTPVPVVEEFTGTWCGWCTVGYDGMEKTKETYGDQVVLIAAHNGDPMEITDYAPITNTVSSYPSSYINRTISSYPQAGNLAYYINTCLNNITVGEIKANAVWANAEQTKIKVDTDTKFVYSDDNAQYGIAYVLVENGLTGTGSSWAQANYLSGDPNYAEEFPFWYNAGSKVTGVVFNHVAVGAWNIKNGMNGSVSTVITAGETQQFTHELDIAAKSVIQDKTRLRVVALLIDRSQGSIVNASEVAIKDFDITAIRGIEDNDVKETERYTLNGSKIAAPQKGVNVVKMSDGTARKVLVR